MGRGKGGSTSHGKRTPGGIQTSSAMKMSSVGDLSRNQIRDIDMSREAAGRVVAAQPAVANKVQDKKALQMQKRLDVFKQRFDKSRKENDGREFDPDVVGLDIERWERAFNKKTPGVRSLEQYATHEDLHNAMANFRTKKEEELEKKAQDDDVINKGLKSLGKDGAYEIFEASNAHALSHLADGSRWCVRNLDTAQNYLRDKGNFQVIHKDGKPLAAIHAGVGAENDYEFQGDDPDVWYHTDFSLRTGQNYTGTKVKPVVMKEDFDFINKYLESNGKQPVPAENANIFNTKDELFKYATDVFNKGDMNSGEAKALILGYREEFPQEIEEKIYKDLDKSILRAGVLRKRIPAIEERVVASGVEKCYQYAQAFGGRFKGGEAAMVRSPEFAIKYAKNVIKGRFPEAEAIIAGDPRWAVSYAADVIKGRFPEAEAAIAKSPTWAWMYAQNLNERFLEGEATIAKAPDLAVDYSENIIKGRFPEAIEAEMAKDAEVAWKYGVSQGGRFPEPYRQSAEDTIMGAKGSAESKIMYLENNPGLDGEQVERARKDLRDYEVLANPRVLDGEIELDDRIKKREADIARSTIMEAIVLYGRHAGWLSEENQKVAEDRLAEFGKAGDIRAYTTRYDNFFHKYSHKIMDRIQGDFRLAEAALRSGQLTDIEDIDSALVTMVDGFKNSVTEPRGYDIKTFSGGQRLPQFEKYLSRSDDSQATIDYIRSLPSDARKDYVDEFIGLEKLKSDVYPWSSARAYLGDEWWME